MKDLIEIGKITSPHGIKGEVKVYPLTDDPQRFLSLKNILINGEEYTIETVRIHKDMIILKIKNIEDRNNAEKLKDSYIKIMRENAVQLDEGQFFIIDLIGLSVYENNNHLGILKDIIQSGSTDIYIINIAKDNKDIMVPAIKEYILNIDIEKNRIEVNIPKGLKEL